MPPAVDLPDSIFSVSSMRASAAARVHSSTSCSTTRTSQVLKGYPVCLRCNLPRLEGTSLEEKAGGVKSSYALSFKEADSVFTFARALLEFEQPLRRVWRAYLRGACAELHLWGPKDCEAVFRGLELFSAFAWRCQLVATKGVRLCSDGPALSPSPVVSRAN